VDFAGKIAGIRAWISRKNVGGKILAWREKIQNSREKIVEKKLGEKIRRGAGKFWRGIERRKFRVGALLVGYSVFLLLQSSGIQRLRAGSFVQTNLVAIFVEEELMDDLRGEIQRYATQRVQKNVENGKALVLPVDGENFAARDLRKILENLYFDGIQGEPSELVGTILVGDLPLPVVNHQGSIFQTIFPLVDLEKPQYLRDPETRFWTLAGGAEGVPELRHSVIQFDAVEKYEDFFGKLQRYAGDPAGFVGERVRVDDFVKLPMFFQENQLTKYFKSFVFAQDWAQGNLTTELANFLAGEQNAALAQLPDQLQKVSLEDFSDYPPELAAEYVGKMNEYVDRMQDSFAEGAAISEEIQPPTIPAIFLEQKIAANFRSYPELIGQNFFAEQNAREETLPAGFEDFVDSHRSVMAIRDKFLVDFPKGGTELLWGVVKNALQPALEEEVKTRELAMLWPVLVRGTDLTQDDRDEFEQFFYG